MKHTRIIALVSAVVLTATALPMTGFALTASAAGTYNYGEALQKSMFFYEVQQSGPLADWNEVTWRADSMMNDYVQGGWFDAGDHIKFALTNAYSSAILAWGILEFPEGVEKIGLMDLYKNNLAYSLDFLAACDKGDEVVYQIGDLGFDHKWWGSAEVYLGKLELMTGDSERPYFTTKDSNVTGEMAAALAAGSLVFKESDPTRSASYLKHAINCFTIADTARTHKNTPASDGMYPSSHFYDELFYAANWLYRATGEQKYLDLCKSDYIPNLGLEDQSTEMKYTWGMCWDDVQQGGTLLYAMNTGDTEWIAQFKKHLEYWTTGYGGKKVGYTSDGLAWLTGWGSLRHATTTAFMAAVANKELYSADAEAVAKYKAFYESQVNYCLGDNANKMSYVIGMGENFPKAWHHRTSSGVWDDQWTQLGVEKQHRHTLYGALVGGPDQTGKYTDVVSQYERSEVAIDYNAGYTALLCAMVDDNGGTIDKSFPAAQLKAEYTADQANPNQVEFFMQACINQSSDSYSEIKTQATNHSAFPARAASKLSFRYFFDISEVLEAGLTVDDISVRIGYDEYSGNTVASKPTLYDGTIYYVEFTYTDSSVIVPTGQSEHQAELQFRISLPDNQKVWDPTNDWSYQELKSGNTSVATTPYICMYDNGVMIWGIEPDGTTPGTSGPVVGTTTTEKPQDAFYGDVNCSGAVEIGDAILLNRYVAEDLGAKITEQGLINADCDGVDGISSSDTIAIMKYIAHLWVGALGPKA